MDKFLQLPKKEKCVKKEDKYFGINDMRFSIHNKSKCLVQLGKRNQRFYITTPLMKVPFGISEYNNSYLLKLEFDMNNPDLVYLYNWIKTIEAECYKKCKPIIEYDVSLKSQIVTYGKTEFLLVKIPLLRGRFLSHFYDMNGNEVLSSELNKNVSVTCQIYIDKMWYSDNICILKWKLKNVQIYYE